MEEEKRNRKWKWKSLGDKSYILTPGPKRTQTATAQRVSDLGLGGHAPAVPVHLDVLGSISSSWLSLYSRCLPPFVIVLSSTLLSIQVEVDDERLLAGTTV